MTAIDARQHRYSAVAILFHWIIAALVIANLAIGLLHESLLDGVTWAIPLHISFGLTVLILSIARLAWRLMNPAPPAPTDIPQWQRVAAHATHWGLYGLMLLLPLTGWLMISGGPRSSSYFGLFVVPKLPVGKALSGLSHEGHGVLGWIMLALVVLHVAAALRHHFILRDSVLARMVPGAGSARR